MIKFKVLTEGNAKQATVKGFQTKEAPKQEHCKLEATLALSGSCMC